jgi:hypothetical protein
MVLIDCFGVDVLNRVQLLVAAANIAAYELETKVYDEW